jgi:hypothetical protein
MTVAPKSGVEVLIETERQPANNTQKIYKTLNLKDISPENKIAFTLTEKTEDPTKGTIPAETISTAMHYNEYRIMYRLLEVKVG